MNPSINPRLSPLPTTRTDTSTPPFIDLQDTPNIPPPLSQAPTLTETKAENINTQTLRDELSKALENKENVLGRIIRQGIGNPHAVFDTTQGNTTILEHAILNCPVIALRLLEHRGIDLS